MLSSIKKSVKQGRLFVLSAPAGTGKTTLVKMLQREYPRIVQSVSCTTRKKRPDEIEGEDYFFLSRRQFEERSAQNEFLEYVELYGDFYGTSRAWVEDKRIKGKHVFLVIDTQGALKIMNQADCCMIFIYPPSIDELKRRLIGRKTESEEVIERRLNFAASEIEKARFYDYSIVNETLDEAYLALKSIVIAEEHRTEL